MSVHFLNADLDIYSNVSLQLLTDEIGDLAFLLYRGPHSQEFPYLARYEIDHDPETKTPESLIKAFCDIIDTLSLESRALWDGALKRVIDLGYETSQTLFSTQHFLSSGTLQRMANLKIDLAWTHYPNDDGSTTSVAVDESSHLAPRDDADEDSSRGARRLL